MSSTSRALASILFGLVVALTPATAHAQQVPDDTPPAAATDGERLVSPGEVPEVPEPPVIQIRLDEDGGLSRSVALLLLLTVGAVLPGLLLVMTSFTRYVIVLGITKNAIGLQTIPPSQVLIGLALFLTVFTMGPTLHEAYREAVVPMLEGEIGAEEAIRQGFDPFRRFMLQHAEEEDLRLFAQLSGARTAPTTLDDLPASVLVPAFVVSELRQAFLIGFVIFVPFLVIDLVVSAVLMSMGMVMLPPVFISLPLKLLLFVLVDGWSLIVRSVVGSVIGGGA